MEENKYIEGFNDGFLIATHRPEAAQDLVKAYQESPMPYLEGLKDGIEERAMERGQEPNRLDELKEIREHKRGREKDVER